MKYAIVKNGSGQQKISEGDKINVLGTTTKPSFDVVYFADGDNIITDENKLKEIHVAADVLTHFRTRKLVVGRYKSKSRYDKQTGFRAQYTTVVINSISMGGKKAEAAEKDAVIKTPKVEVKKDTKAKVAPKKASKKLPTKEKSAKVKKTSK